MTSTTLSALFACKHFCSFFIRFKGAKVSEREKENLGGRGGGTEKVSSKKLDSTRLESWEKFELENNVLITSFEYVLHTFGWKFIRLFF